LTYDIRKPIPYLPLAIIGFAMHLSILIYAFVLYYLSISSPGWVFSWRVFPDNRVMLYVFGAMALSCAGFALAAPLVIKPTVPNGSVQPASLFLNFSPPTTKVQQITIVRMAIAEVAAILGLVLAFLNQSVLLAVPFLVLGLIVQFIVGPIGGKIFGGPAQP